MITSSLFINAPTFFKYHYRDFNKWYFLFQQVRVSLNAPQWCAFVRFPGWALNESPFGGSRMRKDSVGMVRCVCVCVDVAAGSRVFTTTITTTSTITEAERGGLSVNGSLCLLFSVSSGALGCEVHQRRTLHRDHRLREQDFRTLRQAPIWVRGSGQQKKTAACLCLCVFGSLASSFIKTKLNRELKMKWR